MHYITTLYWGQRLIATTVAFRLHICYIGKANEAHMDNTQSLKVLFLPQEADLHYRTLAAKAVVWDAGEYEVLGRKGG